MDHALPDFEKLNPTRARCWAVVADKSGVIGTLIEKLKNWGVPQTQIGAYVTSGDFTFGFRFEGGYLGEVKLPYVPK